MSLKIFHIFFILCALVLVGGLGLLEVNHFAQTQALLNILLAVIFFAGALGLAVYLLWFLKKSKRQNLS